MGIRSWMMAGVTAAVLGAAPAMAQPIVIGVSTAQTGPAAVADVHEAAMEEAGLQWEVDGDASAEIDVRLLQRALSNLIGNATRHAERGSRVTVSIQSRDGEVEVRVVNRGETIASEHLPRLFDRFYRVDVARTGGDRNHGLGLAIVAAIARMHGGAVLAESRNGITSIGLVLPAESRTAG